MGGVCLFNYALDQGENPAIEENQDDDEDDHDQEDVTQEGNDAAWYAQGITHRQWLVEQFCQN